MVIKQFNRILNIYNQRIRVYKKSYLNRGRVRRKERLLIASIKSRFKYKKR